MVHFSIYDCVRSIPLLLDGLKPSQRKVLHWALKHSKSGEKKVSQIVGLVSSATGYHHGEESLVKVIVHLAQDFVGTNNINLLEPIGMFGTRLNGRDVHASARYIHTKLTT
ncbi:TOP2, partial [Symbiodinium sp. KB8]